MQKFFKQFFIVSFLLTFVFVLTSCTGKQTEKITISGSTTILPISEDWASLYNKEKGILVNVQGGGSTNGINLVKSNKVDIGASSRNLSEEEAVGLKKIEIGKDALAIVVNPSNPIEELSTEQLVKIFSGQIKNWKELGGADKPIQVLNRESGSGTRSTFEELIICPHHAKSKDCPQMILTAIVLNSNAEVKRSVQLIPDSIGYISFGFLDETIKPLNLDGITPIEDEVKSGAYPLARGLYYLVNEKNQSELILDFIEFIHTPEAQEVLTKEGFLPVK